MHILSEAIQEIELSLELRVTAKQMKLMRDEGRQDGLKDVRRRALADGDMVRVGMALMVSEPTQKHWQTLCDVVAQLNKSQFQTLFAVERDADLLAEWPWALRVVPQGWVAQLIAGVPCLGAQFAKALMISEPTDSHVQQLSGASNLGGLYQLKLRGGELKAETLGELLKGKALEGLVWLYLDHPGMGSDCVGSLLSALDAGALPNLTHLTIEQANLTATQAQSIAQNKTVASRLIHLDLRHNVLGPQGGRALLEANIPSLKHLDLGSNALTDAALDQMIYSPLRLDYLGLAGNDLTDDAARAMALSPSLVALETLSLEENRIATASILTESPHLKNLRVLDLDDNAANASEFAATKRSERQRAWFTDAASRPDAADSLREQLKHVLEAEDFVTATLCYAALGASPSHWASLCEQLDLADIVAAPAAFELLLSLLARWPSEQCLAPRRWLNDLIADRPQPRLRCVRSIFVPEDRDIGDAGALNIARNPYLTNLESLGLSSNRIRVDGAAALSRSEHLASLVHLDLSRNDLTGSSVHVILNTSNLPKLTSVNFNNNNITSEDARAFHTSRALDRLYIGGNPLGAAGIRLLVASPGLRSLRVLDLSGADLDADALVALAQGTLTNLQTLILGHNNLRADGLRALVNQPTLLQNLHTLDLQSNSIENAGAIALAASPHLTNLTALNLRYNNLGDKTAAALASSSLPNLLTLDLALNRLSDEGIITLTTASFQNLQSLSLSDNQISNDAVRSITKAPFAKSLTRLELAGNDISAAGLNALSAPNALPNLRFLDLRRNDVSDDNLNILANTLPHCQILWQ